MDLRISLPVRRRLLPPLSHVSLWLLLLTACLMQGTDGWPDGTYGLPMPKSGCPKAENFHWQTGTRTQQTEAGSHASDGNHLAGIESTKRDPENKIVQTFCIKNAYVGDGDFTWEKGKYCIYQKGACPKGFEEGWMYWDDATPLWTDSLIQGWTGTLPEGTYDRNTKVFYCCRNDGYAADAIRLPTTSPFYLMKWGQQCQEVRGMDVSEEWVYWSDEDTLNLNNHGGLYPKVQRSKYPYKYTKLFYCYYTQKAPNHQLQTALMVIYIIAGVVGLLVVVFMLICLIQRCCACRQKRKARKAGLGNMDSCTSDSEAAGGGAGEHMLPPLTVDSSVHDAGIIFKPGAGGGTLERKNGTLTDSLNGGLTMASAPPEEDPLYFDDPNTTTRGGEDDNANHRRESESEKRDPPRGESDFLPPLLIGSDGRPRSQPPSYNEVLMEDTRRHHGGRHGGHGGLFRRLDNDLYEDDLIREDNKL